jgi:hypothetical protein
MSLAAPPEAIYPDVDSAFSEIQEHTRDHGYAFRRHQMRPTRRVFACDRTGKYDLKGKDLNTHSSKQRQTGSKKCGCLMRVELRKDNLSSNWVLKVLESVHNHGPSAASTAHPAHRLPALAPLRRTTISTLARASISTSQILTTLRTLDKDVPLIRKDISNLIQKARLEELDGRTPIQWLLEVRYLPLYLPVYTNLYRSLKTTTLILNISPKVDLSSDLPLYIQPLSYFGSRILISYSSIVPIRPTGSTCHS